MAVKSERVNLVLRKHHPRGWEHATLIAQLHKWADRFNKAFKLGVTTPAIRIDKISRRCLGHYCPYRNGFGLRDEIAVSDEHALRSPRWRVLGTVLHELVHQWQHQRHARDYKKYGSRGNYHDAEMRRKAAEFGLEIDHRGVTSYPDGPTPFRKILRKYGVKAAKSEAVTVVARRGPSKTKYALWECSCKPPVKLRVGRSEIDVTCNSCEEEFRLKGK